VLDKNEYLTLNSIHFSKNGKTKYDKNGRDMANSQSRPRQLRTRSAAAYFYRESSRPDSQVM
jgi:hypothetical protein